MKDGSNKKKNKDEEEEDWDEDLHCFTFYETRNYYFHHPCWRKSGDFFVAILPYLFIAVSDRQLRMKYGSNTSDTKVKKKKIPPLKRRKRKNKRVKDKNPLI